MGNKSYRSEEHTGTVRFAIYNPKHANPTFKDVKVDNRKTHDTNWVWGEAKRLWADHNSLYMVSDRDITLIIGGKQLDSDNLELYGKPIYIYPKLENL